MKSLVLTAGAVGALSASASAATLLGVNNLAPDNFGTAGDTLVMFDFLNPGSFTPSTTVLTRADNGVGITGVGGLDYDGNVANPTLYIGDSFGANPGEMFTVNPATGVATSLGVVGGGGINDLAWNPADGELYAVVGNNDLWANVDDPANAVNLGTLSIPNGLEVGLAFDSQGNIHVHDVASDAIYAGTGATTSVSQLHAVPYDSNFSQGLFIDWSRDDQGYHAGIDGGALMAPNHLFDSVAQGGGSYGPFTGTFPIDPGSGLPSAEIGDLTRAPIPAPSAAFVFGLGGVAAARRRRR